MSTATKGAGLTTQSIDSLLTAAYALTHRIHAVGKIKTTWRKGTPERLQVEADEAELRELRDMIGREIKRRAGED
jgi:hypothetical protein